MFRLALITLVSTLVSAQAFACAACQDRDVFKNSFVANTNSAVEAAAEASAPVATAVSQPLAPRERGVISEPAIGSTASEPVLQRKPSVHIRSFNELK